MSANIIVQASEVWGYFQKKKSDLFGTMILIAENPEYGTEIYISNDCGYPDITVTADNMAVAEEIPTNQTQCYLTMIDLYNDYLTVRAVKLLAEIERDLEKVTMKGSEEELGESDACSEISSVLTKEDELEIIEDREDWLDLAVSDFIAVATDETLWHDDPHYGEIIEDVKDHFCEYLARKHNLPVRRPMYLEYPDGVKFEEYPYENMEFEDKYNPIYKKK